MPHRVKKLTIAQRLVLVFGLGVLLLAGWLWWYLGDVRLSGGWVATAPEVSATDSYETRVAWPRTYPVANRRLAHLAVPILLILVWTLVAVWLLGDNERDRSGSERS